MQACFSVPHAVEPEAAPRERAMLLPLPGVLLAVEAETAVLEPARRPLTAAVISRDFIVFLVIGIFLSVLSVWVAVDSLLSRNCWEYS